MSIPANPRESEPIWEAEGDTTRGGINRVYYDVFVTVRDSHGAEYTPPMMSVYTDKNYIISLGYERGDEEEDTSDDCLENTEPTLTLSPNPAGEYVDIRIDFGNADNEPSNYVMDILNTSSYPVRNAVLSGGYNRVNVQGLQKGYYVVRIRYGDTVLTKPLMVE
ncbi:MAG: T9SS type A sorting domain-containing protein [Bacteroidales bacterium]|nr:T9SS type A sorting domain-containing protein [Bacteroidales bacterium]